MSNMNTAKSLALVIVFTILLLALPTSAQEAEKPAVIGYGTCDLSGYNLLTIAYTDGAVYPCIIMDDGSILATPWQLLKRRSSFGLSVDIEIHGENLIVAQYERGIGWNTYLANINDLKWYDANEIQLGNVESIDLFPRSEEHLHGFDSPWITIVNGNKYPFEIQVEPEDFGYNPLPADFEGFELPVMTSVTRRPAYSWIETDQFTFVIDRFYIAAYEGSEEAGAEYALSIYTRGGNAHFLNPIFYRIKPIAIQ